MSKLKNLVKSEKSYKPLLYLGFACFLVILIWIVIFKVGRTYILKIAFHFTLRDSSLEERFFDGMKTSLIENGRLIPLKELDDFALNVLAFVPFGIYLPLIFKKHKFLKSLLIACFATIFFEAFQLFTMWGIADVDDLIANTLGFFIGYFAFLILCKRLTHYHINTINLFVILIATPICLYAILGICKDFNFYRTLVALLPTRY